MSSVILRMLKGMIVIVGVGAVLLFGGYGLSRLLIPSWPQDYHATFAIALTAFGLIGYTGWVATRK